MFTLRSKLYYKSCKVPAYKACGGKLLLVSYRELRLQTCFDAGNFPDENYYEILQQTAVEDQVSSTYFNKHVRRLIKVIVFFFIIIIFVSNTRKKNTSKLFTWCWMTRMPNPCDLVHPTAFGCNGIRRTALRSPCRDVSFNSCFVQ